MSETLAKAILSLRHEPSLWYLLEDQFREKGYDSDADYLHIDGMTQDMVDTATERLRR